MAFESTILGGIPTTIDVGQDWLVTYWAGHFGISRGALRNIIDKVGPETRAIADYIESGVTIAVRDDAGELRRITKIIFLKNGVAVSVPYHAAKEGWLFDHPMMYDRTEGVSSLEEMTHFSATDRVKLSIHFGDENIGGLVHFSRGGKQDIISGYDAMLNKAKGLGVVSPDPVNVTTGPLFGIQARSLDDFKTLGKKHAEVFEPGDLWHHPRNGCPTGNTYMLEVFMFDKKRLPSVYTQNGRRILKTNLPFIGMIQFPFELRVIEIPHLRIFLGAIIHRVQIDMPSGYSLNGPGCGGPGEEKRGITAWYPKPDFIMDHDGVKSLDKPPTKPR